MQGLGGSAGNALAGVPAGIAAAALLIGAVLLWLVPVRVRSAKAWTYSDKSSRDSRVDLMRGLAILFVVVNHVGMTSLFQLFTQEAIGFVSGAELFVLLSGLVLGMVYGPKAAQDRIGEVAEKTGRRAGKLYVTALAVVVLVFVISLIPALNSEALTTFTDQGTGGAGRSGAGRTYDLYTGMQGLLQFPVSAAVIPAVLLLQFGPWQFNVMGLYVIMLLVSPLILLALARGKVLWVLAGTVALYVAGTVFRFRLLPSQFEDSFPLLVWQVLFVLGLVGGYYRRTIVAWLSAHRWVVGVCAAITVAFALMSWGNPYLANEFDVRLALSSDANYRAVYDQFFGRTYLEPGRLAQCAHAAGDGLRTPHGVLEADRTRGGLAADPAGAGHAVCLHHARAADRRRGEHPGAAAGEHLAEHGGLRGDRGAAVGHGPDQVPVPHHPHLTLSHRERPGSGRGCASEAGGDAVRGRLAGFPKALQRVRGNPEAGRRNQDRGHDVAPVIENGCRQAHLVQ